MAKVKYTKETDHNEFEKFKAPAMTEDSINFISIHDDGASAYQIIKIGSKRFKLHANTSKSSCCGFDSDMCVKIVLQDGRIENLFDARSVGGYPNGSYTKDKEMAREHVEVCFAAMRKHLKELYL